MMLATKYRPEEFSDVVGQPITTKILENQLKDKSYSTALMFAGSSGCGKTTCAKIFAKKVHGELHELDCASHNGVAEIKEIINDARQPSLVYNNKVYILDEAHTLSPAAWSAMLIFLEEKLPNTIMIFCTTDLYKIPNTILSRVQIFDFGPVPDSLIVERLKFVCKEELLSISNEALTAIAESANGSMRQALTYLDKCLSYGDLSEEGVNKVLQVLPKKSMPTLYEYVCQHNKERVIFAIRVIYNSGYRLQTFMKQFLDYCIYETDDVEMLNLVLTILDDIRHDDNPKNIIIARLLTYKGGGNDE